jgi:hypothetical protein
MDVHENIVIPDIKNASGKERLMEYEIRGI